jgi:hypothetical protein
METIFKRFVVAGMVMTSIALGNPVLAIKDKDMLNNPLMQTKEHHSIQAHLRNIEIEKTKINALKGEIKEWKSEKYEAGLQQSRIELKQAKADLKCEKAYLKADKKVLLENRGMAIEKQRQERRNAKYALMEAKCQLRKDMRKGNTEKLEADAKLVDELTRKANTSKEEEFTMREERNEYVLFINKEINNTKGESVAVTSSENTLARLNNLFLS